MYKNTTIDMSADIDANRELKPVKGIVGRMYKLDESDVKKLDSSILTQKSEEFIKAAANTKSIPRWMGGRIDEARQRPEFASEDAKTILKAFADDTQHVNRSLKAVKEERYVQIANSNGSTEVGEIVNTQNRTREGMWVGRDQEGRVRQTAQFKEGKLDGIVRNYRENRSIESTNFYRNGVIDGTARQFNEKGEVIHRSVYEGGKLIETKVVDPAKEAADKAQRQAEFRTMSALKMG